MNRFASAPFLFQEHWIMTQSKRPPIFNTMNLEREIEAEIRNRPPLREGHPDEFAPPAVRAPALSMPDYVEHRDGATEIGKLSSANTNPRQRKSRRWARS